MKAHGHITILLSLSFLFAFAVTGRAATAKIERCNCYQLCRAPASTPEERKIEQLEKKAFEAEGKYGAKDARPLDIQLKLAAAIEEAEKKNIKLRGNAPYLIPGRQVHRLRRTAVNQYRHVYINARDAGKPAAKIERACLKRLDEYGREGERVASEKTQRALAADAPAARKQLYKEAAGALENTVYYLNATNDARWAETALKLAALREDAGEDSDALVLYQRILDKECAKGAPDHGLVVRCVEALKAIAEQSKKDAPDAKILQEGKYSLAASRYETLLKYRKLANVPGDLDEHLAMAECYGKGEAKDHAKAIDLIRANLKPENENTQRDGNAIRLWRETAEKIALHCEQEAAACRKAYKYEAAMQRWSTAMKAWELLEGPDSANKKRCREQWSESYSSKRRTDSYLAETRAKAAEEKRIKNEQSKIKKLEDENRRLKEELKDKAHKEWLERQRINNEREANRIAAQKAAAAAEAAKPKRPCTWCDGRGTNHCSMCTNFPGRSNYNSRYPCTTCDGTLRVKCHICKGSGKNN